MATRAYRRDSRGRFAGGGGGTKVTYGRAGGFARGNTFGAQRRVAGNARSLGRGRSGRGALGNARVAGRGSRLQPVTSRRAYTNNVSKIRRAQRRNFKVGQIGLGLAAGGVYVAARGSLRPGRGRSALVGGVATVVGVRAIQRAQTRGSRLSAQLGQQTRSYNKIKGGTVLKGGNL